MVLSMDRWVHKVAVVTGAGGGIGEAVVKQLLEENLQVVGIDNSQDRLNKLLEKNQKQNGNLFTFTVDVTDDNAVKNVFKRISEEIGAVHVLVNTAGIIRPGNLIDGQTETWKQIFDTNILGTCITTREAVQIMKVNQIDGHIINICSITGHSVPNIPQVNVYPASKFAVRALSETYRQEFNRFKLKIKVTNMSPGKVNTLIAQNNDLDIEAFESMPGLEPSDIADAIVYVLSTPPHVQVHELTIKPVGETI